MSTLLTDLDAWIIAVAFAAAMLAAWAAGRFGARQDEAPAGPAVFDESIMALLGLLLAFTFSMSLVKHEQRRQMSVADSNAIGDFYTCVSLLPEPVRGELQAVVRGYIEHRLSLAAASPDETALQRRLDEIQHMQGRMQSLVGTAIEAGTPVGIPLVITLNGVTSSHAARLSAVRDRLPWSIVLLLFTAAVLMMAIAGRRHGRSKPWRPATMVGFTVLVSMVVWVTLDLNQPQQGSITISQEPLEQLLQGMQQGSTSETSSQVGNR